jgi:hypothetical protein
MSRRSPFVIVLSEADRVELVRRAASYCEPYAVVIRSKIVLLAADGLENVTIAGRLGVCVDVVSKWRKRFSENGIEGLADRKRAGRLLNVVDHGSGVFSATVVHQMADIVAEQDFSCRVLDGQELGRVLNAAGFGNIQKLTADGDWLTATRK